MTGKRPKPLLVSRDIKKHRGTRTVLFSSRSVSSRSSATSNEEQPEPKYVKIGEGLSPSASPRAREAHSVWYYKPYNPEDLNQRKEDYIYDMIEPSQPAGAALDGDWGPVFEPDPRDTAVINPDPERMLAAALPYLIPFEKGTKEYEEMYPRVREKFDFHMEHAGFKPRPEGQEEDPRDDGFEAIHGPLLDAMGLSAWRNFSKAKKEEPVVENEREEFYNQIESLKRLLRILLYVMYTEGGTQQTISEIGGMKLLNIVQKGSQTAPKIVNEPRWKEKNSSKEGRVMEDTSGTGKKSGPKAVKFLYDHASYQCYELALGLLVSRAKVAIAGARWDEVAMRIAEAERYAKKLDYIPLHGKLAYYRALSWAGRLEFGRARKELDAALDCSEHYPEGNQIPALLDRMSQAEKKKKNGEKVTGLWVVLGKDFQSEEVDDGAFSPAENPPRRSIFARIFE